MKNSREFTWHRVARSLTVASLLLSGAAGAVGADSYDPATRQLTIPAMTIGTGQPATTSSKPGSQK